MPGTRVLAPPLNLPPCGLRTPTTWTPVRRPPSLAQEAASLRPTSSSFRDLFLILLLGSVGARSIPGRPRAQAPDLPHRGPDPGPLIKPSELQARLRRAPRQTARPPWHRRGPQRARHGSPDFPSPGAPDGKHGMPSSPQVAPVRRTARPRQPVTLRAGAPFLPREMLFQRCVQRKASAICSGSVRKCGETAMPLFLSPIVR